MKKMITDVKVTKTSKLSKTVIAADGKEYPREKCRKINNNYYLIGNRKIENSGHVIEIDNTFYRITPHGVNPRVAWDIINKQYDIIDNMRKFIIDVDKNGMPVTGFSKITDASEGIFIDGAEYYLPDHSFLNKLSYDARLGQWTFKKINPKDNLMALRMDDGLPVRGILKRPYHKYPVDIYSISDYPKELRQKPRKKFKKHPYDKFLTDRTYGVEIETSNGHFPELYLPLYGLVPLKDGSISGHEYTSVVYDHNTMGVEGLAEMFEEMAKYTISNKNCSLHYHIGNLPRTKSFVVALWQLYFRLQDEFDNIMPPYKRNITYLANKQGGPKDHCARLLPLISKTTDSKFDEILSFCNDGQMPDAVDKINLKYVHRRDGARKWEYESRYVALNFIPYFFDEKRTVEFRLHSGTVNKYKAISWLFICLGLVEYAIRYSDKIIASKDKILLEDIIRDIYDDDTREGENLTESLLSYIQERKENNRRIYFSDKNGIHDEFKQDNTYVPKTRFNF